MKYLNIHCLCYLTLIGLLSRTTYAADCKIPLGRLYERSVYRPQHALTTDRYSRGESISGNTRIVAICKSDIYHDAVRDWTSSKCTGGRWVPALPQCKVKKRCRAPPSIGYATASERITPYITFPHDTTVTYACDADKMATGTSNTVCEDGTWSTTSFACTEIHVSHVINPCDEIAITNGMVYVARNDMYYVTCNAGFQLRNSKQYWCRYGQWIGDVPTCVHVAARCKLPAAVRERSVLKLKTSGKVLKSVYINHRMQVVQVCKRKSRNRSTRTVRCINGQWRPQLKYCPKQTRRSRQSRTYSDCKIPNIYDDTATYSDVISGRKNAFQMGDIIQHGRTVLRICSEGFMVLPLVQTTTILTTMCTDGKWEPKIKHACGVYENDAVFSDPTIESMVETTTEKSARKSTTKESPVETTTLKPATEPTTKESPVEITTLKPATEPTTKESPVEITTLRPVIESTTNESPVVITIKKQTRESTSMESAVETTTKIPAMESATVKLSIEITTKTPATESATVKSSIETSTGIPATESTTLDLPDTEYRIRVQGNGDVQPYYIVLDGNVHTGVRLELNSTTSTVGELTEYRVIAQNVGQITRFWVENRARETMQPHFISIHNSDEDGFYIDRYDTDSGHESPMTTCRREFSTNLKQEPTDDWNVVVDYKYTKLNHVKDATDCKLRCIEASFRCRVANYLHSGMTKQCYVFEAGNTTLYQENKSSSNELFRRLDIC